MKVSNENIISIRKFISNYLFIDYCDSKKLTHDVLFDYMIIKHLKLPKKRYYKNIIKSDVLTGKVLLVSDDNNKVICYENPSFLNTNKLLMELKKIRNSLKIPVLNKEIEEVEEYNIEHSNRIKVLSNKKYLRRNKNVKY